MARLRGFAKAAIPEKSQMRTIFGLYRDFWLGIPRVQAWRLRIGPEPIEARGQDDGIGVAERQRASPESVGLQWGPVPEILRYLDDQHLAGWTRRTEAEGAIGGEEDIRNAERWA